MGGSFWNAIYRTSKSMLEGYNRIVPRQLSVHDYHLVDETGAPFFWFADTAWNLWCKGHEADWDRYLTHRKDQGFNVIQFVAGWWRGSMNPVHGRPFDLQEGALVYSEAAWESLDRLFERIRAHGMVAAPVMLWTLTDIDPGQVLSEEQCIEVASRMAARWPQQDIVWLLGGDGNFTSPEVAARWKRIGRAVFGENPAVLATLHPCGATWVGDDFANEPWYQMVAIQSGHGTVDSDLRFLTQERYASTWAEIRKPFLNLEPNYEDASSYHEHVHLTDYHVRRASYWSLLVAPPAGVTFGIGSVWMWATTEGEIAENHDSSWQGRPWHTDLDTEGARSMTILRRFFEGLDWTNLRPAPTLICSQDSDPNRWVAAAQSLDGETVVVYSPQSTAVDLPDAEAFEWRAMDPATGDSVSMAGSALSAQTRDGDVLYIGTRFR